MSVGFHGLRGVAVTPSLLAGRYGAGQLGAGGAHRRCQQVKNAFFQGQVALIFKIVRRARETRQQWFIAYIGYCRAYFSLSRAGEPGMRVAPYSKSAEGRGRDVSFRTTARRSRCALGYPGTWAAAVKVNTDVVGRPA